MSKVIIGVTGHRPDKLGGYGNSAQQKVTDFAYQELQSLQKIILFDKVITGMALGWDQAVGLCCLELGIPYIAAVPFAGQERKWPEVAQRLYWYILGGAEAVHIVSEGGYEEWKMEARNRWIVERSNLLLALSSGAPGGTEGCITLARESNIPVLNLWEAWTNFSGPPFG